MIEWGGMGCIGVTISVVSSMWHVLLYGTFVKLHTKKRAKFSLQRAECGRDSWEHNLPGDKNHVVCMLRIHV